jgi:hypothetical protein
MSILAMMQGKLVPKILMTGFLNFLVFEPNLKWVIRSIIYVVSTIIFHNIPLDHVAHKFIMRNTVVKYILFAVILVWMIFILKPQFIWGKNLIKNIKIK